MMDGPGNGMQPSQSFTKFPQNSPMKYGPKINQSEKAHELYIQQVAQSEKNENYLRQNAILLAM